MTTLTIMTSMITTVTAMMSGVVPSAAEQKYTIWHETRNRQTQKYSSEGNKYIVLVES